jgi:hypothetical protein
MCVRLVLQFCRNAVSFHPIGSGIVAEDWEPHGIPSGALGYMASRSLPLRAPQQYFLVLSVLMSLWFWVFWCMGVWMLCVCPFCRNSACLHPIDSGIEAADLEHHDLQAAGSGCSPPCPLYRSARSTCWYSLPGCVCSRSRLPRALVMLLYAASTWYR